MSGQAARRHEVKVTVTDRIITPNGSLSNNQILFSGFEVI
jgi:hypothetical protein